MGDQADVLDLAAFASFVGMTPETARRRIALQNLASETREGEPFVRRVDAEAFKVRHDQQSAMLTELYADLMETEDDQPAALAP